MKIWVTFAHLGLLVAGGSAETVASDGRSAPTAEVVHLDAQLGWFCHKEALQFLFEGEVAVSEQAAEWATERRFEVGYSRDMAVVKITPPHQPGVTPDVRDLLREVTELMMNTGQCSANSRSITVTTTVDRLDFVEKDGEVVDFKVTL